MASDNILEFDRHFRPEDKVVTRLAPLSIISVGRDSEVLRLREKVIRSRSDLAVRSLNPEEAERPARAIEPHLWIFCRSIELPTLVWLAGDVRRYSAGSKLLLLVGSRRVGFEAKLFHHLIDPLEGVEQFLNLISYYSVAA